MAIDIETVRAQQRELNKMSDGVLSVKRKLVCYQEALDDAWKSAEIKGIDSAMEEIICRLNRLSGMMENLGHDIMVTGEEIRAEEETAKAEAERARRLAAESKREKGEDAYGGNQYQY